MKFQGSQLWPKFCQFETLLIEKRLNSGFSHISCYFFTFIFTFIFSLSVFSHISCHFWLRSGSAQFSVISLAGSKNSRGGQMFPEMIGPWTFGFDICIHLGVLIFNQYLFNIQPISIARIASLDLFSGPISKFNVIKIQNEERVQRSAILKTKLG